MNVANGLENLYVRFRGDDMEFLLSAFYIETMLAKDCEEIREAGDNCGKIHYNDKEIPLYFFNEWIGASISHLEKYVIVIETNKKNFAICVDQILDVIMWDEIELFSVPSYIKNERNIYLDSAGTVPNHGLAYIIDPEKMEKNILL